MPSRIRIGPDGGPYVIVEENNGDLDITTPDNTIDLQNSGLINAALSGVLDAQNNDISNVGALTADSVSTDAIDITPEDSGTVSLTANGVQVLTTPDSKYGSDYWTVLMSPVENSGGGRAIEFVSNNSSGLPYLGVREQEGDPIEVNWAVVRMSVQP